MQRINLQDTEDSTVLGYYELTNGHIHWCIEGMINTSTEEDAGYEIVREWVELYRQGKVQLKLSPLQWSDDNSEMVVRLGVFDDTGEARDFYELLPPTIAAAIARGMTQPAWNQMEKMVAKGNEYFGEGNWKIDWHIGKPVENEEAVVSFILLGVKK